MNYPDQPGHQDTDTSIEAARSTPAEKLRQQVLDCLATHGEMSPDQCASRLGMSILSIRPRFTELKHHQKIEQTGAKSINDSGKRAHVWRLRVSATQTEMEF